MRGFLDMKLGFFDCQTWKSGEWRELTNYGSQYSSQLGASWSQLNRVSQPQNSSQMVQRHSNSRCTCVSHCWWILKLTDQYWITPCLPYFIDIFWSDFIHYFLQIKRHGSRLGVDQTRWGLREFGFWEFFPGFNQQYNCGFFRVEYDVFWQPWTVEKIQRLHESSLDVSCRNLIPAVSKAVMIPSIQQKLKHCRLWNVTKSNRVCIFCINDVGFTPCHKQLAFWWLWQPICGDFGDGLLFGLSHWDIIYIYMWILCLSTCRLPKAWESWRKKSSGSEDEDFATFGEGPGFPWRHGGNMTACNQIAYIWSHLIWSV